MYIYDMDPISLYATLCAASGMLPGARLVVRLPAAPTAEQFAMIEARFAVLNCSGPTGELLTLAKR